MIRGERGAHEPVTSRHPPLCRTPYNINKTTSRNTEFGLCNSKTADVKESFRSVFLAGSLRAQILLPMDTIGDALAQG